MSYAWVEVIATRNDVLRRVARGAVRHALIRARLQLRAQRILSEVVVSRDFFHAVEGCYLRRVASEYSGTWGFRVGKPVAQPLLHAADTRQVTDDGVESGVV